MRTTSCLVWSVILVLFSGLFWGLYTYPVVHDSWGHIYPTPWHLRPAIDIFWSNFLNDNPRIGQTFLQVLGGSAEGRALLGGLSAIALILVAFVLVKGRRPTVKLSDGSLMLWIFLSLVATGAMPGQMVFYIPYNANYVLGLAFLLAFLIPYRLSLAGCNLPIFPTFLTVVALGLAAGMSNEHTVPAVLVALPLSALANHWWHQKGASRVTMQGSAPDRSRIRAWQVAGYMALLASYVCLYFAPGQNARYPTIERDVGIPGFFKNFAELSGLLLQWLLAGAMPIMVLMVVAVLLTAVINRRAVTLAKSKVILLVASCCVIALMATTTLASPLIAPRLTFAASFILAVICGAVVMAAVDRSARWAPFMASALMISSVGISVDQWMSIGRFAAAFEQRAAQAKEQIEAGAQLVRLEPYDLHELGSPNIIHVDDEQAYAEHWVNRAMARYFGANQVVVVDEP